MLRYTGAKYENVTDAIAPEIKQAGMVTSALFTDVDGDHKPDLMVTYEWGPVRYFHNDNGKLIDQTSQAGLANRQGWYNSISGGEWITMEILIIWWVILDLTPNIRLLKTNRK
ncbi:MAG: hypothetical protein CM1200mP10_10820 [Candidatus Neomarinimicrobiota bacterium]|nr:MAG: hypothetical protein CM1200mP10_10820 [Candidatus Neomarinimicrobiota bacterium]